MKKNEKFSFYYFTILFIIFIILQLLVYPDRQGDIKISYSEFLQKIDSGLVERVVIYKDHIIGVFKKDSTNEIVKVPSAPWRIKIPELEKKVARQFYVERIPDLSENLLIEKLLNAKVIFEGKIKSDALRNFFLNWLLPLIFFIIIWGFIFRRLNNPMLDFGKNRAKIYAEKPENQIKFSDVAGIDEAIEEVKELVDFLRNPIKYTRLGGKLPKGVLLVGPPGTGKTLLARAVAGEAGVPFFNMSGSDFVEMFVGLGAARVRDLFQQAKANAPCIIFIDEIDAIGKKRGTSATFSGGYDERENTLNQLLVEMDGFDSSRGVIIMGATNRPEVLDPALLRPGRFDRQILVDRPDLKGREAIFKIHTRKLKLANDVDLKRLAEETPGFVGADIANVCNEAALLAVRKNHEKITMSDFEEAIERIIAGLEKRNKLINQNEKKIVAYHEAGHAIVGYFTNGAEEVKKISIVPRGIGALGYTLQVPTEDRYLMTREELLGKIKGLLGGRAAEEIVFGEISTGAANDIERATKIARSMILIYGMSKQIPNYSLSENNKPDFLGYGPEIERRSEYIEEIIDKESFQIIDECYKNAKQLLLEKREILEILANTLLEKEVLNQEEIKQVIESVK